MKKILCIILCILTFYGIGHAQDRFPIVKLNNCQENNQTVAEIYQCEINNFNQIQEKLAIFYQNIQLFLPEDYQKLLDESQNYWQRFTDFECQINAYQFKNDPEQNKLVKIRCLNYRIRSRIQHLIYIVMIWEETLGSFSMTLKRPENLELPFTLQDN